MDKKLIILDVDGTMIDYKGQLPSSAKEAIIQARNNGHIVVICTGCSKFEIEMRHFDFELDGMILGNGCYIEYHNKILEHHTLSLEDVIHHNTWCKNRGLTFRLECNSGIYVPDDYEVKSRKARLEYQRGKGKDLSDNDIVPLPSYILTGHHLDRTDVNKTAFVLNSYQDYLDALEEFKGLKVDTWGGKGEHALYGAVGVNVDKAIAIQHLIDYLHFNQVDTIAFGDAKVDIPMFEVCHIGVAMGNSGKECLEAADYITDDVNDDGLYKAFKHFNLI